MTCAYQDITQSLRRTATELEKKQLSREEAIRETRKALASVLRLRPIVAYSIDPATLAGRLNLALQASGLRQADLARACDVTGPSVCEWFSGRSKSMDGKSLVRAATALNVTPLWLAEGEGPMHPAPNPAPTHPAKPHRSSTTKGK